MPLAYYARRLGNAYKRFQPYATQARAMYRAGKAGWKTGKAIKSAFSSTNDVSNANQVRFRDMGDRGSANVSKYGRGKRRRFSGKRRRKFRRFRRAVRRAVRVKRPIATLQEIWAGAAAFNAGSNPWTNGQTLDNGFQLVLGNASSWGLNLGELSAAGGHESSYINTELAKYRVRYDGTDLSMATDQAREQLCHYVKRRYLKLTIRNDNTTKDLSFDLYECVAARDISDSDYANPAITWNTLMLYAATSSGAISGSQTIRGSEPTDCPNFGKYWKILKKTKVRIPNNGIANNAYQTFKMYGKPHLWQGQTAQDKWAIKGITKYFMLIFEPEQIGNRYGVSESVVSIYGHRNSHYYPANNLNLTAPAPPTWMRQNITAPSG